MLYIISKQSKTPVNIKVYEPALQTERSFSCQFIIDWPSEPHNGKAYGVDSVQALQLCFNMIAVHLYTSDFHKEGRLVWEQLGDGYGFPLSRNLRDLAQGADKLE
jgi:hypothetical protein